MALGIPALSLPWLLVGLMSSCHGAADVIASSCIFDSSRKPSADNYIASVKFPPPEKRGAVDDCIVTPLSLMHTVLCSLSTYDASTQLLYSLCRAELSPRAPVTIEVRGSDGNMTRSLPLRGPAFDGAAWDFMAVDFKLEGLLLFELGNGGRCSFVNLTSGNGRVLANLPGSVPASWLYPATVYDPIARKMHTIVSPLSVHHATPRRINVNELVATEASVLSSPLSVLSLDVATNVSGMLPLKAPEGMLTLGLWNVALTPHRTLLGVLHNTSRVLVNLTSGQVRLPCASCDSLTALGATNLPLEPLSVQSVAHPAQARARALLRMDPSMPPATGQPEGKPVLYALGATSGKVEAACLLPGELSFGLMLLARGA